MIEKLKRIHWYGGLVRIAGYAALWLVFLMICVFVAAYGLPLALVQLAMDSGALDTTGMAAALFVYLPGAFIVLVTAWFTIRLYNKMRNWMIKYTERAAVKYYDAKTGKKE